MSQDLLRQAVAVAKQGDRQEALRLTKQYIKANSSDERGWYALAKLVNDDDIKIKALEKVLQLNPNHSKAQSMLDALVPPTLSSNLFDFEDDDDDDDLFTSRTYADERGTWFDDDDDPFEAEPPPRTEPQRQRAAPRPVPEPQGKPKQSGSSVELLLGIGVFLLAIVGLVGLGYYAYFEQHRGLFGLFGPDLNTTVSANGIEIRHPDDWENSVESGIIVASNFQAGSSIVCPDDYGDVLFASLSGFGIVPEDGLSYNADESNFNMTLMPINSQVLGQLQGCEGLRGLQTGREYVELMVDNAQIASDSSGDTEVRSDADIENKTIAGQEGVFGYVTLYLRSESQNLDINFSYGSYAAAFARNGQEYLFILTVFGDGADDQQRLAERILRTIEFQN